MNDFFLYEIIEGVFILLHDLYDQSSTSPNTSFTDFCLEKIPNETKDILKWRQKALESKCFQVNNETLPNHAWYNSPFLRHINKYTSFERDDHLLEMACRSNHLSVMKWICSELKLDSSNPCLFVCACNQEYIDMARYLFKINSETIKKLALCQRLLFHNAIRVNSEAVIDFLLHEVQFHQPLDPFKLISYSISKGHITLADRFTSLFPQFDLFNKEESASVFVCACRYLATLDSKETQKKVVDWLDQRLKRLSNKEQQDILNDARFFRYFATNFELLDWWWNKFSGSFPSCVHEIVKNMERNSEHWIWLQKKLENTDILLS